MRIDAVAAREKCSRSMLIGIVLERFLAFDKQRGNAA
jgi:hypothetical protein